MVEWSSVPPLLTSSVSSCLRPFVGSANGNGGLVGDGVARGLAFALAQDVAV